MALKIKYISYLSFVLVSYISFGQQGTVSVTQDAKIETLLEYKKTVKPLDIYKIQIYQGQRANAELARHEFLNRYAEWPTSMEYNTPNYKIWIGNFRSRLEADQALMRIKKTYPNAFIFQPKDDEK